MDSIFLDNNSNLAPIGSPIGTDSTLDAEMHFPPPPEPPIDVPPPVISSSFDETTLPEIILDVRFKGDTYGDSNAISNKVPGTEESTDGTDL